MPQYIKPERKAGLPDQVLQAFQLKFFGIVLSCGLLGMALRSFALDLSRPLLVKGSSIHFLDEPAETWFRERFKPDTNGLKQFLDRLRPLAAGSSYAASILPQLLLAAGQMDELVAMALSEEGLPIGNPLERRDVELQRLIFALKACLHQGRFLPAAKLALKAAGETAGESRQIKLIQENTDIAAVLLSPDRIDELVSRRTFGSSWMGSHHAYDAALLSGCIEFSSEAASRLRMAIDWLYAWARRPSDEDISESVDDADRAELAMAILRLRGPEAAARFLRGWTQRCLTFTSGRRLAGRLTDLGQYEQLDALAAAAGNDVWLLLGLATEVARVGRSLPVAPLSRLMRLLGARRVKLPESTEWNANWEILYAVHAAVLLAVGAFPDHTADWRAVLQRYLPDVPPSAMAEQYGFDRAPMLRITAANACASLIARKPSRSVVTHFVRKRRPLLNLVVLPAIRQCLAAWRPFSLQEAITLTVFVPFAMFYMNQPFKLDYLWAGLCLVGAVYFIFRT